MRWDGCPNGWDILSQRMGHYERRPLLVDNHIPLFYVHHSNHYIHLSSFYVSISYAKVNIVYKEIYILVHAQYDIKGQLTYRLRRTSKLLLIL